MIVIPLGLSIIPAIIKLGSAYVEKMLRGDVVSSALRITMTSTVDQDANCVTATYMDHWTASVMQRLGSAPANQV